MENFSFLLLLLLLLIVQSERHISASFLETYFPEISSFGNQVKRIHLEVGT